MKKSALVPLDGSSFSCQIVPHIRRLFDPEVYRLILLQVVAPPEDMLGVLLPPFSSSWSLPIQGYATGQDVERASHPIYASQLEHSARDRTETALSFEQVMLQDSGYEVAVSMRFGDPAEEIVAYARDNAIDLVVMATHGRTALRQLIMGSVAEQVLRHLTIPVMLVRPFADES